MWTLEFCQGRYCYFLEAGVIISMQVIKHDYLSSYTKGIGCNYDSGVSHWYNYAHYGM